MAESRWSKLAFIGNLLAQVAVVASLLYVGYEIRLNTRVAQAQAHQGLVSLIMSLSEPVVAEIDDVSDLRARADSGLANLTPSDRQRFMALANRSMNLYELAFDQRQEGLLADDVWAGFRASLARQFRRPGFAEYWTVDKQVFGPSFTAFVDDVQRGINHP